MKKLNKIWLGGALPLMVAVPLVLVSCGDSKVEILKDIKPKTVTQDTIDEVGQVLDEDKETITDTQKISELSKLFEGINKENFKKFDTKVVTEEVNEVIKYVITLRSKNNYIFQYGGNTVSELSPELVGKTLGVSIQEEFTKKEFEDTIESLRDNLEGQASVNILNDHLFKGVTLENRENFTTPTLEEALGKESITLTAKVGYTFTGGFKELKVLKDNGIDVSDKVIIEGITVIPQTQKIIDSVYETLGTETPTPNLITTLGELFKGITAENIENMKAIRRESEGVKSVYLVPNDGFIFEDGKTTIFSEVKEDIVPETNLDGIKPLVGVSEGTVSIAIRQYNSTTTDEEKVDIISWLFEGFKIGHLTLVEVKPNYMGYFTLIGLGDLKFTKEDGSENQTIFNPTKVK